MKIIVKTLVGPSVVVAFAVGETSAVIDVAHILMKHIKSDACCDGYDFLSFLDNDDICRCQEPFHPADFNELYDCELMLDIGGYTFEELIDAWKTEQK